jgi:hypothetical protein
MDMLGLRSSFLVGCLVLGACEPKPVEETHVLIVESEIELACEPMTLIIEIQPSSAEDCAQALVAADQPGLLSVFHENDGASDPPYMEEAYLLLSGDQLLLQRRERSVKCFDFSSCEVDPWSAWSPHHLCTFKYDGFQPEPGALDCETVPDWTHEEMEAAVMP